MLLDEDLSPRLDQLLRELISDGHRLVTLGQDGEGPAPFTVGDGLRLYGDAGILNTRTVRAVVEGSIQDAHEAFQLDLDGLDHLALRSWAVVLQATNDFRSQGGLLRVHSSSRTRRLLEMPTPLEDNRTNLEFTEPAYPQAGSEVPGSPAQPCVDRVPDLERPLTLVGDGRKRVRARRGPSGRGTLR